MARTSNTTLRLFLGIYPPADVVDGLLSELRCLDLPANRQVRSEQLHMTLHFIGDTPSRNLDQIIESIQHARKGLRGFALTVTRLITLPRHGPPPRLVAAEAEASTPLLELQCRLARRFSRRPRARTGDRFLPHLTLCRFRRGFDPAPALTRTLSVPMKFDIGSVELMKSVLRPGGAEHIRIASFPICLGAE